MDQFLGSIMFHWSMCLHFCQPHCSDYGNYVVSINLGRVLPPTFFFFSQNVLAILVHLLFHMYYIDKNFAGILIGIALNQYTNWWTLTFYLRWLFQSTGMVCLPIYVYLVCFLSSVLYHFSACKRHKCFVGFTYKHFIWKFYLEIMDGIVFLISVFVYSLLVYRNVNGLHAYFAFCHLAELTYSF